MANDKDFIVNNAVEISTNTKAKLGTITTTTEYYKVEHSKYDYKYIRIATQQDDPCGIAFKTDGTKMYTVGPTDDVVNEFDLSTAWDISTATASASKDVSAQEANPRALAFSTDGTKMYIAGSSGDDVNEYTLSTAWDVTSATYYQNFSVSAQEAAPRGMHFKSDGTKFYIVGTSSKSVHEYSLTTAWDVSTASLTNTLTGVDSVISGGPTDIAFDSTGTKMFLIAYINEKIIQYTLSTAWDVSTATYDSIYYETVEARTPNGFCFSSDGSKMFITCGDKATVYQYVTTSDVQDLDLSTGSYFVSTPTSATRYTFSNPGSAGAFQVEVKNSVGKGHKVDTASYDNKSYDFSAEDTDANAVAFSLDGTNMYIVGPTSDFVHQYTLSTAWDVSTASYANKEFSVNAQAQTPVGLYFKPDGKAMYVVDANGDDINTYTLSTAWDVSTASYSSVKTIATQNTTPRNMVISTNGFAVLVVDRNDDDIHYYGLSTPWAFNAMTHFYTLPVQSQGLDPMGVGLSVDGRRLIVLNETNDAVYEYDLSTPNGLNASTVYSGKSFSIAAQTDDPEGLAFSRDGDKMYVLDNSVIYQYTMGEGLPITWPNTVKWLDRDTPSSPANQNKDVYTFTTYDEGVSYLGHQCADNLS
jgi:DNA-binding beta-propeller fold protein YncE